MFLKLKRNIFLVLLQEFLSHEPPILTIFGVNLTKITKFIIFLVVVLKTNQNKIFFFEMPTKLFTSL
jgi:hypothetical protein